MAKSLRIDVWSDIACPWCYVGKRRLETALGRFAHAAEVQVVWRSFELDPSAPATRDTSVPYAERLATKYGISRAQASQRLDQLSEVAAVEGIVLNFDEIRPGNTFNAHRILHLAHDRQRQDAMKERLLRAYLSEGAAIGEPDVLLSLADQVGLDPDQTQALLASDQYAREVRDDQAAARALGIQGVPFFLMAGRYAVSGAQPADLLLQALTQSWEELVDAPASDLAEGAVCGPDGCA